MENNQIEQNTDQAIVGAFVDRTYLVRGVSRPERREMSEEILRTSRRQRRFGFYKILLLILAVMIAAICAGTVVFWRYIEAYEISRHQHIIQSLRENTDYDFWQRSVESAMAPLLTEFEADGATPLDPHLSKIRDVEYTLRQKSDENTAEAPVYVVRAGARDIGVVRLTPHGNAGFGFNLWEVGSIELLDSFVDSLAGSVSITVSQNARVELNGIPVSQEYRVDCEFEHGAAYVVHGIFGNAEVTVFEFDGRVSEPYFAEEGEFFFPITSPFTRSFNLVAPEGSEIFLDGEGVPPENITARGIVPEIFQGAIDESDVPIRLLRYEFVRDDFFLEPVVTADDGRGNELMPRISQDGEISFSAPFSPELKTLHEDTVEDFIRAYIRFGANIGNNADASFAGVSGRMLRGSELYRRAVSAIGTMRWISGASLQYNSLQIDNFRPYGEGFFTCEIRYNITTRTQYEVREVEGNFEVLFVLSGGRWLAAKMIAI